MYSLTVVSEFIILCGDVHTKFKLNPMLKCYMLKYYMETHTHTHTFRVSYLFTRVGHEILVPMRI